MSDVESQLHDNLNSARYADVIRQVRETLPQIGDSDTYYSMMAYMSAAEFYSARTDSMYVHLDSVFDYLSRRPLTRRRAEIGARAYMARGASLMQYTYEPDSSIASYERALALLDRYDEPGTRLTVYSNMGDAYKIAGQLDMSLDYMERARLLADSLEYSPLRALSLNLGLASVYTELRDFESQIPIWKEVEQGWGDMSDTDKFSYLTALSNSRYYQNDFDGSLRALLRLDSVLADNSSMEWERNFNYVNMADAYLKKGDYRKAIAPLDSAAVYFSDVQPNPYVLDYISTIRSSYHMQHGDYGLVERSLEKSNPSAMERPEQRLAAYAFRRDYYERTGQWQKAYDNLRHYEALDDSLRNQRVQMYNHALKRRYERDAEVTALRTDLQLRQRKIITTYIMVGGAVAVIVLLAIVLVMSRRLARVREESMLRKLVEQRMQNARSRISPHFMYNALNHALVSDETSRSQIVSLVRLLRRQQFIADELVDTLDEELAFIDDYVDVQRAGTEAPMRYEKRIGEGIDTHAVRLPSMTLQIFVENAFKHGFRLLPRDVERVLLIDVSADDTHYIAEVRNNAMPGDAPTSDSARTGLRIISTTLQMLNENNSSPITFSLQPWTDNPQGGGCVARLNIPRNFNFECR